MGAFYGSLHLLNADREAVREAVAAVSKQTGEKFLIGPLLDGWTGVYPEENQNMRTGDAIAEKLIATGFYFGVHDDDVLFYCFYRDGKPVDEYCSDPGYFGDAPLDENHCAAVKPELFQDLFPDLHSLAEAEALLRKKGVTFETERLAELTALLGIPNAVTSYDCLLSGDTDDVRGWRDFIRIPDERAAKREEQTRRKKERREQIQDGVLLLDLPPRKKAGRCEREMLTWAATPAGGAYAARPPAHFGRAQLCEVRFFHPLWNKIGDSTGIQVRATAFRFLYCEPLHRLIVIHASGNWVIECWDLNEGRLTWSRPMPRFVSASRLAPDGSTVYAVSEGVLFALDVKTGQSRQTSLSDRVEGDIAFAAGGTRLALGGRPSIPIVNASTLERVSEKQLKPAANPLIPAEFQSPISTERIGTLYGTRDGQWLACGTRAGCRIYRTEDLLDPSPASIAPVFHHCSPKRDEEKSWRSTDSAHVYSIIEDPTPPQLLIGGINGMVEVLDLQTMQVQPILQFPPGHSVLQLAVASDRSVLWVHSVERDERNENPATLQAWSYPELLRSARAQVRR